MSTLDEIRNERLKKIDILRKGGMDPYPADSFRNYSNIDFFVKFDQLSEKDDIILAGRIMSLRDQGGIVFIDLYDGTKKVQAIIKKEEIDEDLFKLFLDTVDQGDFIEVSGKTFTTNRGVKSLLGKSWRMLAKSLRTVPDEWFGLKDEDERYRRRYIDFLLNNDSREIIKKRSIFWNSIRSFMLERDFLEVETPILETKTGGAEARPFVTHHNALDMDVFLRISTELWHKKLMIAGIPKVFEIGRVFRNEGMSYEHAQDYTHFEFYEAYQDGHQGIPMVIQLYRHIAEHTFGTQKFKINGFDIDLSKEWENLDFNDLMKEHYKIDPRDVKLIEVKKLMDREYIKYESNIDIGRGVDLLWKKVRKSIGGPAIMTGMPIYLEPLAKKSTKDPRVVDRFQILLGGSELGKGFNELNDPLDQRERFVKQQALRDKGDEEAQMADFDYVEAMEYGMPPVFGFGVSERLFSFLLGRSIRESQLFPLMKIK